MKLSNEELNYIAWRNAVNLKTARIKSFKNETVSLVKAEVVIRDEEEDDD